MYNEFIKIKTNYISHANIYSTRNFGSIFFCAFFGVLRLSAASGTAKDSRFGCRRVTADSSGLPLWCGERLLRQGAFGFAPTTTVAGEILASDAGVSRTYEDTLRVRPTGFLFEDPVCSISVLPQRQTVCRMMIFESVILSVSEILCKKLFLCFCCGQKERKTLPFSS